MSELLVFLEFGCLALLLSIEKTIPQIKFVDTIHHEIKTNNRLLIIHC